MNTPLSATDRMARIALACDYDALDPAAREFAKRLLVDALACAIGGFNSKTGIIVRNVAQEIGAQPQATLIGTDIKVSCSAAIIANQAMLRYLDYNDDMPITIGPGNLAAAHPSGSLPVALALTESMGASGKHFIEALVAGYEVIGRLLAGYRTSLEVRGVHHGSALSYGACAMAGRLLGLDAEQIANAMGLAGALSVGLDILDAEGEEYTMTKNMADGLLSERGYLAAMLARQGLTGPKRIVEGHKGFAEVLLGGTDMFAWREEEHAPWILNTVVKSVCAEATTHGHLMATIALVVENDLEPADIASIVIRTNRRSVHHVGDPIKKYPRNKETADHSAYFLTAMAVLHRKITPRIYDEANFSDPRVKALIDITDLEYGPEFDAIIPSAQVTIVLKDQRRLVRRFNREELAGEPSNRMSDARLREKFIECANGVMSNAQVDSIIEACLELESAKDFSTLMKLLRIGSKSVIGNDSGPARSPMTMFDKIWESHVVSRRSDGTCLLYIDRHLVHEVTSPQAFEGLRIAKREVRAPHATMAATDHSVPTSNRDAEIADAAARVQVQLLEENCKEHGITCFNMSDMRQGIVHVVGPEQGMTLPGATIVCGDSHTSTHGAFGALAWGIGTSEVEHVLATQTLALKPSKNMLVRVEGALAPGATAKDLILAIIGKIGIAGGTGHVIEYAGPAISALSMEGRMTLCNMSIECGARAGLVAPDATTLAYLRGKPMAPSGGAWVQAEKAWLALRSDPGARYDKEVVIDASTVAPQVTWGTTPEEVLPISGKIPTIDPQQDEARRAAHQRSLDYMGLQPGTPLIGLAVDVVFIGSCTNSRLEDLRAAAAVVRGRQVAKGVRALVVPGSGLVKRAAESEGLDRIFQAAGFEWRNPGCSMCVAMNGDAVKEGQRCASTSNRNFEGRQGRGARTHLMSPAMAAAAAIAGRITDVREFS